MRVSAFDGRSKVGGENNVKEEQLLPTEGEREREILWEKREEEGEEEEEDEGKDKMKRNSKRRNKRKRRRGMKTKREDD